MKHSLIDLQSIYKIYSPGFNEVRALDGLSLQITEGEFVAIVGRSGSGKSTLMNMIGCLDVPTHGHYYLNNREVSPMSDDELSVIRNRQIGFVFQGFNLIPSMNAQENVELPLQYRGVPRPQRRTMALEALCQVGLSSRLHHRPAQMSGGQQQRVAIARALAAKPSILLADEPTGNLDSGSGKEVLELLRQLWREGKTIILITHDDQVAFQAGRIVRIHDGKILEDKSPEKTSPCKIGHTSKSCRTRIFFPPAFSPPTVY